MSVAAGRTAAPIEGAGHGAPVRIHGVTRAFGAGARRVAALRGLEAEFGTCPVTGLVGPDGAGKTTLMRLLTGLLLPDTGCVEVLGHNTRNQAQTVQGLIAYMPQRFGLYEDLTVAENLTLYADLRGLPRAERPSRFAQLMTFTGLAPFTERLAGKLSGGMKQKLGLACTLVRAPQLLLLDEPSVGVDPVSRRELWQIVQRLAGDGMRVLWSTAYLDEAQNCDEVLVLHQGRLLAQDNPRAFLAEVAGRTFDVAVPPLGKRDLQQRLQGEPELLDAIIKGRKLHLLLARPQNAGQVAALLTRLTGQNLAAEAVTPVFEDAFIARLLAEQSAGAPPAGGEPPHREAVQPDSVGLSQPAEEADAVIEVAGLTRRFGAFTAVDDVTFNVQRGEIFGLLGPNGAGKSTTFKMLCGLLPPSDGKALVLGHDLRRAAAKARAHIGYMAQLFTLYGDMTVLQNLNFFAAAYGLGGSLREQRVAGALEDFDLAAHSHGNAGQLPLGHQRRLALACATLHRPGILFLDEPTSGVDPLVRREFWNRINRMVQQGVTVLVTTHFMDEAEYCDRIGIVYRGRLVALSTPDELKDQQRSTSLPDPTLEDAFISLVEQFDAEHGS